MSRPGSDETISSCHSNSYLSGGAQRLDCGAQFLLYLFRKLFRLDQVLLCALGVAGKQLARGTHQKRAGKHVLLDRVVQFACQSVALLDHSQGLARGEQRFELLCHAVEIARTANIPQSNLSFPSVSFVSLNAERAIMPITAAPMP